MKTNTLFWLLAAGAAYYLYKYAPSHTLLMTCQYPDGTIIQIPQGNACPYDMNHGGQSQLLNTSVQQGPCASGYFLAVDPDTGHSVCLPVGSVS